MNLEIERSGKALELPLNVWPRILLILAIGLVLTSYAAPVWRVAASGPDRGGLAVTFTSYRLGFGSPVAVSGTAGSAVTVVPLRWISVGVAFMALLFARAAVLGTLRSLIDAFVLYMFFGIASLWSFSGHLIESGIRIGSSGPPVTFFEGLFGEWSAGGSRFAASPAPGAWLLMAVVLVLAAALFASWKSARQEFSADFILAG